MKEEIKSCRFCPSVNKAKGNCNYGFSKKIPNIDEIPTWCPRDKETDKEKSMGQEYLDLQNKKYDFLKFQSSLGKKILDDIFAGKFPSEFMQEELKKESDNVGLHITDFPPVGSWLDIMAKQYERDNLILNEQGNNIHIHDKGSRFNEGKLRWSLVDLKYLEGLVQVLMNGAAKYSDYNWQKGLPTLEIYESLMRHIVAWRSGEDKDKESGLDHIDHAICNLYFMKWMIANKPSFDTRKTIMPEQEFTEPKYPSENEK